MPRAGHYRHRVQVQETTEVRDSIGSVKKAWVTKATIWCSTENEFRPSDNFVEKSATMVYDSRMWFYTRANASIQIENNMRLLHNGKQYEILEIQDEFGLKKEIRLLGRKVPR